MLNLSFMGVGSLLTFVRMLRYWKDGFYDMAACELLDSRYAQQVGHRAKEIANMIKLGDAYENPLLGGS